MKRFDIWIPLAILFLGMSAFAFVQRETLFSPKRYGQPRVASPNKELHTADTTKLLPAPAQGYIVTEYGDSVGADYDWNQLIARIKRREGFVPTVYRCAAGVPTIGYGHSIKPGDSTLLAQLPPEGISKAQADSILRRDLAYSRWFVEKFLGTQLTKPQLIAVTNFCYAFGTGNLHKSQIFKNIKANKPVVDEFAKWIHINGNPSSYLAKERAFEQALYRLGEYNDDTFALAR